MQFVCEFLLFKVQTKTQQNVKCLMGCFDCCAVHIPINSWPSDDMSFTYIASGPSHPPKTRGDVCSSIGWAILLMLLWIFQKAEPVQWNRLLSISHGSLNLVFTQFRVRLNWTPQRRRSHYARFVSCFYLFADFFYWQTVDRRGVRNGGNK